MVGTSSSPTQRIRKREESDQCQKTTKPKAVPSTKIPIQNRISRTQSELQLQEDMKAAEWRDLCMFSRLVGGMRERQNAQASHFTTAQQEQQRRGNSRTAAASAAANSGPDAVREYNRHALLTDQCVENIVWMRHQEITSTVSVDDNADAFESVRRARREIGRRFSRGGKPITHSEAYGHYVAEDRSSSAPPPLFPDLRAVSGTHGVPPGPYVVEPDEDSGEGCVFNLDL